MRSLVVSFSVLGTIMTGLRHSQLDSQLLLHCLPVQCGDFMKACTHENVYIVSGTGAFTTCTRTRAKRLAYAVGTTLLLLLLLLLLSTRAKPRS